MGRLVTINWILTVFGIFLVSLPLSAFAGDEKTLGYPASTLTGDWGGARMAMAERGLLWEGTVKLDGFSNRGGIGSGAGGSTHVELKLKADFARFAEWDGGTGVLQVIDDRRTGINARRTGSLMGVTNIEVPVPTSRLFQAWLQQSFLDDRFALLAGLYPIDSEFFAMDSAGIFLGPQYGTPADLALTRGPSIFNNSAFGLRAKAQTGDRSTYAMGAVLDGIPNDPAQPKRTTIKFAKGDGAFGIAEIGWLPQAANEKFEGHAKLAFGVWRYTAKVNDQLDVDSMGNPLRRRSAGGYLLGERTLLRFGSDGGRYASAFCRYTWTDGDSTPIANSVNLGVHAHGPLPSRPDDILGAAWTRSGLAGKFRQAQRNSGTEIAESEDSFELTYRIQVTPWLGVQPLIQNIRHPGGTAAGSPARLIGVRAEIAL